jgi:hypothetical protein
MTANQLYASEPQERTTALWRIWDHLSEITTLRYDIDDEQNQRVEVRLYEDYSFDGRRIWVLGSVWFDDQPVLIFQNAGREGRDHSARYITDPTRYWAMLGYLQSLVISTSDTLDPDVNCYELTDFYGCTPGVIQLARERAER